MSRMWERMDKGEPALGTISLTDSPEWMEIMGHVGFDFGIIDFMITSVDWSAAANMIRGAMVHNMTPWIRLQGYPWGNSRLDPRTTSDVLRALSIGAECVMMSIDTVEEVEAVLSPASNWHRRVFLHQGDLNNEELRARERQLERETLVIPHIESKGAARAIDRIMAVSGVRAVFLGMGDLSRELGHAGDPTHPEMREFVARTVALGRNHGVKVMANTGYRETPEAIQDAAQWLWDNGVSAIWLPYMEYVVAQFYPQTLRLLRSGMAPVSASSESAG